VDTDDPVLARFTRDRALFTQLVPRHSPGLHAYLASALIERVRTGQSPTLPVRRV
jgi:hypothetical protein